MHDTRPKSPSSISFRFAEFELSTLPGRLRRKDTCVALQPQPCRALTLLCEQAGEVVTRQQLREHLWGAETFLDHEQGINFTIRRIRSALEDDPAQPRFIETVPRLGYRFIAPVERITSKPASPPSKQEPPSSPTGAPWARPRPLAWGLIALALLGFLAIIAWREGRPIPPRLNSSPAPPNAVPASAYEAYLRGRYLLGQEGSGTTDQAIAAFEQCTAEAPEFAPGYAALASALLRKRFTRPSSEIVFLIEDAARKALELDHELAEAHLALATVHFYFALDWDAAETEFRRALELEPESARALHGYGLYLASLGRHDEAAATIRHALTLDPRAIYATSDLSLLYFWDRRYDAAIAQARENLEARANDLQSLGLLVDAMMRKGDEVGTLEAMNHVFEVAGLPHAENLSNALARSLEHMIAVDAKGYHLDVEIAAAHLARNQKDLALERLRQACRERSDWMLPFINVDPRFDALRAQPADPSIAPCLTPRAETGPWIAHLPG